MNVTENMCPAYHRPSGWNALLPARAPSSKLPDERKFDIVIIGAGYTGLAAARRIAQERPDQQVLVLEGSTIGEGASGRNSGFVIDIPHNIKVGDDSDGRETALRQIRIYEEGLSWLEQLVRENRIDCGWNPVGKFYAAVTEGGEQKLRGMLPQYRDWGIAYNEFDRDGLKAELGTSYYRYGFYSSHNVFVQPAALIRGLAATLPANVTVVEQTPVTSLSESSPFRVTTPRCEFTANKVVVANNGFAASLGLLKDRLMTIHTYAAMTPKLHEEELAKLGRPGEWGVLPGKRIGSTIRKTADGRFLVRSAQTYGHEDTGDRVLKILTESYRRRYPNMASHTFEHFWSGVVGLTRNGANFFGELRPKLYVSVGCNGVGILKGSMFGRLLGELALGVDSQTLHDVLALERPTWLPPEPFRRISVMSAIRYQAAVAGAER
ncbi:NAD(P)/FAD-dependent oxidoreductase [Trinickia dinghuensis]|uniref:FAD-dependent oxidoreductase n=1 Tax=Trinickia dinghuensis TaxID=2291023 RepID=A0A3D8JSL2_9BURK|nr:FAD-dependent oxidoreductase [Trinickia dinghuensis]RDU95860.1 FAD-dependent oxidoreductase [Trinickia dinghuensis]